MQENNFKEYVIYTDRMIQTDTILWVAVSVSNFFFRNRVDVNILRWKKNHTVPSITIFLFSYPVTQHQSSHLASSLFQMLAPSCCKCYSH